MHLIGINMNIRKRITSVCYSCNKAKIFLYPCNREESISEYCIFNCCIFNCTKETIAAKLTYHVQTGNCVSLSVESAFKSCSCKFPIVNGISLLLRRGKSGFRSLTIVPNDVCIKLYRFILESVGQRHKICQFSSIGNVKRTIVSIFLSSIFVCIIVIPRLIFIFKSARRHRCFGRCQNRDTRKQHCQNYQQCKCFCQSILSHNFFSFLLAPPTKGVFIVVTGLVDKVCRRTRCQNIGKIDILPKDLGGLIRFHG